MPVKTYLPSEQRPLTVGERLCDLPFLLPNGKAVSLYEERLFGWPKVIHVLRSAEKAEQTLSAFSARLADFARFEAQVVVVTSEAPERNAAVSKRLQLVYPILSSVDAALHNAAGFQDRAVTLVLDPLLRVDTIITGDTNQVETALEFLSRRAPRSAPAVVQCQAPALVLPNILDSDHCDRLIRYWEGEEKIEGKVVGTGPEGNRVNRRTKVRSDVFLPEDAQETLELSEVLNRRLMPEIWKGFNFRVTGREALRIGCYDAAEQGHFSAHRDDSTPHTRHRRYAMSLNLNTGEYEGGLLRFPEFGPQLYAPPRGGAVVFSCSLLHMVLPVTKGRRIALFGFFYGDQDSAGPGD